MERIAKNRGSGAKNGNKKIKKSAPCSYIFLLIFGVFALIILMEYFAVFGSENMEYITIKEAAEKWNLSVRRVQTMCNEGMIQDTIKFGHAWAIPKDAEKPADKRIKTKKYMKR